MNSSKYQTNNVFFSFSDKERLYKEAKQNNPVKFETQYICDPKPVKGKKKAYDDDVAVAPRDLIAAAEEGANGIEELADLGLHSVCFFAKSFGYK